MYIYSYKNGEYTHEFIIKEDENVYLSNEPIDCTKFKPGNDGAPVEIVVEQPVYVAPETSEVFTAANDTLYANDTGNDTLCGTCNDTLVAE